MTGQLSNLITLKFAQVAKKVSMKITRVTTLTSMDAFGSADAQGKVAITEIVIDIVKYHS